MTRTMCSMRWREPREASRADYRTIPYKPLGYNPVLYCFLRFERGEFHGETMGAARESAERHRPLSGDHGRTAESREDAVAHRGGLYRDSRTGRALRLRRRHRSGERQRVRVALRPRR